MRAGKVKKRQEGKREGRRKSQTLRSSVVMGGNEMEWEEVVVEVDKWIEACMHGRMGRMGMCLMRVSTTTCLILSRLLSQVRDGPETGAVEVVTGAMHTIFCRQSLVTSFPQSSIQTIR